MSNVVTIPADLWEQLKDSRIVRRYNFQREHRAAAEPNCPDCEGSGLWIGFQDPHDITDMIPCGTCRPGAYQDARRSREWHELIESLYR